MLQVFIRNFLKLLQLNSNETVKKFESIPQNHKLIHKNSTNSYKIVTLKTFERKNFPRKIYWPLPTQWKTEKTTRI